MIYKIEGIPYTKEYILSQITEEDIFIYYLGVKIQTRDKFISPLRRDKYPTCTFKYCSDGKLRYRDWTHHVSMDCFDLVKHIFRCNFYDALQIIGRDIIKSRNNKPKIDYLKKIEERKKNAISRKDHRKKDIIISSYNNRFTREDGEYLSQFGITTEIAIEYNIFSVSKAWMDDRLIYNRFYDNPCIGYYFGKSSKNEGQQKWKLYFYKAKKGSKQPRFITNTNRINGWLQLPDKGEVVIITKSLKDVMVLHRYGISSISMQAENIIPYQRIIDELRSRFKTIYTLYDFDKAGIQGANQIKKLYNIPYLFLYNGKYGSLDYGAKDISDYFKNYGESETLQLIFHVQEQLGIIR